VSSEDILFKRYEPRGSDKGVIGGVTVLRIFRDSVRARSRNSR
jgi:hypothetical protein